MKSENNWKQCYECIHWAQRNNKSSEYYCPYAKLKVIESTDADECVEKGLFIPVSMHKSI